MKRFYIAKIAVLFAILFGWNMRVAAQSATFTYTGAVQSYTVGTATLLGITAIGGCGGTEYVSGCATGTLALGGMVQCHLAVTPGQILWIYVGGAGVNDNFGGSCGSTRAGGWNGGVSSTGGYGSSSGGGTDIRTGSTSTPACSGSYTPGSTYGSPGYRLIVAGAGGAGADYLGVGGAGGGLTGGTGVVGTYGGTAGTGGTQTAGGGGGPTGAFGTGGAPGDNYAGGGGGYWGGGGGNGECGGAGGGSSYTDPTYCSSVVHTQGYSGANGNGIVTITVLCTAAVPGTVVGSTIGCIGQTTTYTDPTGSTGGYWTSDNTAVATVGSLTGVATGISAGTAHIAYNLTVANGFCSTVTPSLTVTVAAPPLPVSGNSTVCIGTPDALTTASTGGTWSSKNTALANISTSGVVTGIATGQDTILYTNAAGCSAIFPTTVNLLPNLYSISGGGTYCAGSAAPHVMLSNSDYLVSYQLLNGITPVATLAGNGSALDFGPQAASGTYTIMATNLVGGCPLQMSGSVTIATYPSVAVMTVTGGGAYCAGSAGSPIGLSGSTSGVTYQVYNGLSPVGISVTGTGSALPLGTFTDLGTHTVVAYNPSTGCSITMGGSVSISMNPVPPTNSLTTPMGTSFCAGSTGVSIGLNGSSTGVTYKLMDGSTTVGTFAGTGSPFTFSTMAASTGSYTIVGYYSTGCSTTMAGTAAVASVPLPPVDSISGGGGYCLGSLAGVPIGMEYSVAGVNYQLFNSVGTAVSTMFAGTDSVLSFGSYTTGGAYHVVATNASNGCTSNMAGTAVVTVNPLPVPEMVTGGGSYCPGSSTSVSLGTSAAGISYQLYNGSTPVGSAMAGTGHALTFSSVTGTGTLDVVATNTTTGCTNGMTGTVLVSPYPAPSAYSINGGGSYCATGTGVAVGLDSSDLGTQYQLYLGGTPLGIVSGSGTSISFGSLTTAGTYTVRAMTTSTGCSATMPGTSTVTINPLPTSFSVMGGGPYCAGAAGSDVSLSFSSIGVNYQLYMGSSAVGSAVAGTGGMLDLGVQSAVGTYTVVATNAGTSCASEMSGSAVVSVAALPTTYSVAGTGSYCQDGTGLPVTLGGSTSGNTYQLFNGSTAVGSTMTGTGLGLNFGLQTVPGNYTIEAMNSAGCTNVMTGVATIVVNPLPTIHTVTGGGGYCASGAGIPVGLDTSDLGVNYTLYNGSTNLGNWLGTGTAINFGTETAVGAYTVVAKDTLTGCVANMSHEATVTILSLPLAYTVIGGGSYCAGAAGSHVMLSSSTSGVEYYLNNGGLVDSVAGTGHALDFGAQTMTGTYTVNAMNSSTGCVNNMALSASISINPLPDTFTVTGGGSYCAGGVGMPVSITGSNSGVNYKLYNGTSLVGTYSGTGSSVSFGDRTAAGVYTVVGVNPSTGCTNNMNASASIIVNPVVVPSVVVASSIPTTICAGTAGDYTATVGFGGSTTNYQWFVNGAPVGTDSAALVYTPANGQVITVTITSSAPCAVSTTATSSPITMTVIPEAIPVVAISSTSNNVCSGTEVNFTAAAEYGGTAAAYTWIKDGSVVGTGSSISYALLPTNGDSVSVMMTSNYPCLIGGANTATSNVIGVSVSEAVNPVVLISANPGSSIKMNTSVTFTASVTDAGATPSYQWMVNGNPVAGANSATYTNNNFNDGDVVACSVTGSNVCGTATSMSNAITLAVENTTGVNVVTFSGADVKLIPNPNKGDFTVKGNLGTSGQQTVAIEITNTIGQVVYKQNLVVVDGVINQHIQLDNSLASGVYLLNLSSDNHSQNTVFHFVVE